jgi:hypothetical protein
MRSRTAGHPRQGSSFADTPVAGHGRLSEPHAGAAGSSLPWNSQPWDGATYFALRSFYSRSLMVSPRVDQETGIPGLRECKGYPSRAQNASHSMATEKNAMPPYYDLVACHFVQPGPWLTPDPASFRHERSNQNIKTTIGVGGGEL